VTFEFVVIFVVGGEMFYLDIPPEAPAFLCEKMGVELDLKKMADMTVDDMIQKQNVLYISRGQLKKHTSTVLNISLNVRYISQQVSNVTRLPACLPAAVCNAVYVCCCQLHVRLAAQRYIVTSLQRSLWWKFIHTISHSHCFGKDRKHFMEHAQ
jgi:hypothetical protein